MANVQEQIEKAFELERARKDSAALEIFVRVSSEPGSHAEDPGFWLRMGETARKVGERDTAVNAYRQAIGLLARTGTPNNALAVARRLVTLSADAASNIRYGQVAVELGYGGIARDAFFRAADAGADNGDADAVVEGLRSTWAILKQRGMDADAESVRARIVKMRPDADPASGDAPVAPSSSAGAPGAEPPPADAAAPAATDDLLPSFDLNDDLGTGNLPSLDTEPGAAAPYAGTSNDLDLSIDDVLPPLDLDSTESAGAEAPSRDEIALEGDALPPLELDSPDQSASERESLPSLDADSFAPAEEALPSLDQNAPEGDSLPSLELPGSDDNLPPLDLEDPAESGEALPSLDDFAPAAEADTLPPIAGDQPAREPDVTADADSLPGFEGLEPPLSLDDESAAAEEQDLVVDHPDERRLGLNPELAGGGANEGIPEIDLDFEPEVARPEAGSSTAGTADTDGPDRVDALDDAASGAAPVAEPSAGAKPEPEDAAKPEPATRPQPEPDVVDLDFAGLEGFGADVEPEAAPTPEPEAAEAAAPVREDAGPPATSDRPAARQATEAGAPAEPTVEPDEPPAPAASGSKPEVQSVADDLDEIVADLEREDESEAAALESGPEAAAREDEDDDLEPIPPADELSLDGPPVRQPPAADEREPLQQAAKQPVEDAVPEQVRPEPSPEAPSPEPTRPAAPAASENSGTHDVVSEPAPASDAGPDQRSNPFAPPADAAAPPAPAASSAPEVQRDPEPPPPAGAEGEFIDLASLILGEDEDTGTRFQTNAAGQPSGDEDRDFAEILDIFRREVSQKIHPKDSSSHYDLGVAYKEMGLLDDAIAQLQLALRAGANPVATLEVIGECFLEKNEPSLAKRVLERATQVSGAAETDLVGVLYWMARCEEVLTNPDEARGHYERVIAVDISFRDAAERLRDLRTAK